ncbi:MAG TPA: response regulator, partial [Oligoflexia bacterium]|nr:response regulator [Oligoflexia bacterium]
ALQRASSSLVVVGCPGLDPVDMIYNFFDTYFPDEAQYADAAKKLLLSFIHVRVKRTCAACTKSTSVTPANIERLPEVLRVLAQDTYMFSRGCPKCGNSAYRGTIGLNSAAGITADLQQVLTDRAGAEAFTQAAYQNGTRTILEDGLQKIYSGLTSFEQVFSVVSTISPAFALAAARTAEAAKKASPAAERPLDPNTEPPSSPSRRQRRKVLIVEDEVEQRDVLRIVFEKEGYTVVPADNGKHALEILAGQSVDAILCDVMMPVMNGFDFVKALRENPTYQRTPVLMLTAANSADDEVALLSLGADDYCGKNLKRKILLQRVERVLERKRPDNPVGHLLEDDE